MAPTGHIFQAESEGVEPSGVNLARFSRPLADQPAPPSKSNTHVLRCCSPWIRTKTRRFRAFCAAVTPRSIGKGRGIRTLAVRFWRPTGTTYADQYGSDGTRTRIVQLMRLVCYRYTTKQSPVRESNSRPLFGRQVCYLYTNRAEGLHRQQPKPTDQPSPDSRNRTYVTCSQGRRYATSLYPDGRRSYSSADIKNLTPCRHAAQVQNARRQKRR